MGFWRGEKCEYCGGALVDRRVVMHRMVKGRHVIIENVPAGVCSRCGTRFYAAGVLKSVEAAIHGRRKAEREVRVQVYSL